MAISDGDRHEAYLRRVQQPVLDVVLAVLRRRAAFIAGVTIACVALSLVYVLLATPRYVASGRILLEASSPGAVSGLAGVDSQITILTSRGVFDRVIEREKLETDPLFGGRSAGILRALLVGVGVVPASDQHTVALRQLERAVNVRREPGSSVVNVDVTTPDRETSARVANAVMESYIADVVRMPQEAKPPAGVSAETSLEALQGRLKAAEQSYQTYRQDNGIAGTNGQQLIEQQVSELSAQIAAADARVSNLRSTLAQVQRARSDRDFGAIPEALRSKTFEALKSRYTAAKRFEADLAETLGPKHPDLKLARLDVAEARRLLDQTVADMVQSSTSELERARSAVTRLKARRDASQKELVRSSETSALLAELEQNVETTRAAYQAFLLQSRNLGEQPRQVDRPGTRILSRAMPPLERGGAAPIRILLISLLLGFGLAVSLAWLLELIDERRWDNAVLR